ncbi:hypothetical protein LRR81_03845 [Metabacillus sp. GX 13764]|uniref:YphA family membrane protein n=1 Tax=Metabacillus kandeliae TaxID=2900151 RepID=UPI001E293FCC|nr:hypothetical protein [Metabacillus kandeliae]MCD7033351.1 hypothetical protein [Metabacillus kandeliae]
MEGILYYWIFWCWLIIAAFLWPKGTERTMAIYFILINLASSQSFVHGKEVAAGLSSLEMWAFSMYLTARNGYLKSPRFLLGVFGMMAGYAAIQLFQLFDPVWFIVDKFYILLIVFTGGSLYIGKDWMERMVLFTAAMLQGEFLYWAVIRHFYEGLFIGGADFLDLCASGTAVIGTWTLLGMGAELVRKRRKKNTGSQDPVLTRFP